VWRAAFLKPPTPLGNGLENALREARERQRFRRKKWRFLLKMGRN
jgi:DNA-binding helix-hairpin-helix protein with protein kinase domain